MQPTAIPPRDSQHPKSKFVKIWTALLSTLIMVCIALSFFIYFAFFVKDQPNDQHITPDFAGLTKPIFVQGEQLQQEAKGSGPSLALPFTVIQEHLDPHIHFDESSESVVITTDHQVIQMRTDQLTALLNDQPFTLHFPVVREDEALYVPVEPLKQFYPVTVNEHEGTGAVLLQKAGDITRWGEVTALKSEEGKSPKPENQMVPMRTQPTIKAPILVDLQPNDRVMIWDEQDGWYRVQLESGYMGYVDESRIQLTEIEVEPEPVKEAKYIPWKPIGGKINLTWEQVSVRTPDPSGFGEMPGLNVISPTWFHLMDGQGNIQNLADAAYVHWAHQRGYQVWALFSNSFKPDITHEALSSFESRKKMIQQLLAFVEMYDLQGINIDFENVYLKDKDLLTQFVRELTPYLHEQDAVVSIDVTIRGGSEMWSLFYDREELGKVIDYMMVMTYDEHWAASPVAGSVASLPWVEKGITDIIREDKVPASKILIGVPYYTRIWSEAIVDGEKKVSSKAVFMDTVQSIVQEKQLKPVFLPDVGQHYVEYEEDGVLKKIWIEDEVSMRSRIELVNKLGLAGVASWRRGYESPDIWSVIQETLDQRPH